MVQVQLAGEGRIELELWKRIFTAVGALHHSRSTVVLHGGDPLLLPVNYLREVAQLRNAIFGSDWQHVLLALQSNAAAINDGTMAALAEFEIGVSLSYDAIEVDRRATEANIERLQALGLTRATLVTLSTRTAPQLRTIYDWHAERGLELRIVLDAELLPSDAAASVMCELFNHWLTAGAVIKVAPFDEIVSYVAHKILGIYRRPHDRGIDGDRMVFVGRNGNIYHLPESYDSDSTLGNLRSHDITHITTDEPYWASIRRDRAIRSTYCISCEYASSCGGEVFHHQIHTGTHTGRCPIYYNLLAFIDAYLLDAGFGREDLVRLVGTHRGGPSVDVER